MVLLDLMLPGEGGLNICRRLRTVSTVPIIILTALGAEADRVADLELGADDYHPPQAARRNGRRRRHAQENVERHAASVLGTLILVSRLP
jgi:DNA-binding response OmpR family regulator